MFDTCVVPFRPTRAEMFISFAMLPLGTAILALQALRLPPAWRLPWLVFAGLCALGVIGGTVRFRRRARLVLSTDGRLTHTGLWRTRAIMSPGESGRVVRVRVFWRMSRNEQSLQLWTDATGRTRLTLYESMWDASDLARLSGQIGLQVEQLPNRLSSGRLRRVFPGSISLPYAYPVSATIAAIVLVFVPLAWISGTQ